MGGGSSTPAGPSAELLALQTDKSKKFHVKVEYCGA